MAARTDRVEARIDPERVDHAERLIDEHQFTEVDEDHFDRLIAALDEPARPLPALAHAARQVADQPAFERR